MNLKDWEIKTIEALAQEAFERESEKTEIRHPEAWLEKAIRDRQVDAQNNERYRQQLLKHAERLGIGQQHPKRVSADDDLGYEVASKDTAAKWCRIIGVVQSTERDHPWRELHYELITKPLLEHRHSTDEDWEYPNHGFDALALLEEEAIRHGLFDANEEPEVIPAQDLASRLLATLNERAA